MLTSLFAGKCFGQNALQSPPSSARNSNIASATPPRRCPYVTRRNDGVIVEPMQRDRALAILKQNEAALRSLGLRRLSLFGSTARNEAQSGSDVDIAVQFSSASRMDLFGFAALTDRLRVLLDQEVDIVTEPSRSERLQAMIDRDRVDVF